MTFQIRTEETDALRYKDFGFAATNIKRLLKLVRLSAAKTFNENFKELKGFSYQIEGGNSDINFEDSLVEIQNFILTKRSIGFNYKITCDNGDSKYASLYYRTPRKEFIERMIYYLNLYKNAINFNITQMSYKEDTGGKNPRLYLQYRQTDQILNPKTGKKEPKSTNINFNFALKYAGDAKEAKALDTLKPSHVTPSITDIWLTPKQLYDNVITYIKGSNFPVQSDMIQNNYVEAVTSSHRSKSLNDNLGIAPELSSEFFEILTCLKLANLMESNDKKTKQISGYPDDIPITQVQIKIPGKANESLLDYYLAVNGNTENPLKISVKSKVRGKSTAPVKFTDAFANEAEVHNWFKSLKFPRAKNYNIGQRMIASSSLEYSKYNKKVTLYPIRALRKLLSGSKSGLVQSDFIDRMDTKHMNIAEWKNLITLIDKKMGSLPNTYVPLDDIITDKKLLLKAKKMIAENLYKFSQQSYKLTKDTKDLISDTNDPSDKKYWEKNSPSKSYPFSINNVALLCERVLVRTSQKTSSSKFNFYKLFYDQILTKREIMYAVTERKTINDVEHLVYTFRSAVNYRQYEKWISLRTKNYANYMGDQLGMQT